MNPELLVKMFEFNRNIVISRLNKKCKFYVKDLTHFALTDSAACKYLNAIKDSKERYRFLNDASRLEYILHLAENTTVNVALPNGQWKKAKFLKVNEKDNKMFITVELLETPERYLIRSLEACAVSFKYSSKGMRYSLPPNMIKKIDLRDLYQKIEENLQIDAQVNEVLNSEGENDKDFTDKAVAPHEGLKNQPLLDRQDDKVSKDESKNNFSINDVTENAERNEQLIQSKVCDEGEGSNERDSICPRVVENKEDHSEKYISQVTIDSNLLEPSSLNTVCIICHYLNGGCSNVCLNCGEEISLQYNSQANVGSNVNMPSSSLTETQINRWSCVVCFSPNINDSIVCFRCGEKKVDRSLQNNSQTKVDLHLIVPLSSSIEIPLNPYATNEYHGLNNHINKEEDLMNHHESTVRFNSKNETKCIICKNRLGKSEGFFLRLCEHTVCKICTNKQITLPKLTHNSNLCCERSIELNEIRYLLPDYEYEQFKKYLVQLGETNSYIQRCFDKNCSGYHLWEKHYDKNHKPSEFSCNKCKLDNCLNCGIIHHNLKCEYYLKLVDEGNSVDKETKKMFLTWIGQGIAMLCPECKALIEKDEGCDWVQCSFCRTEICWATRGRRWGSGGSGDTSGGCGCSKENKCTKNCNYCH